MTLNLIETMRKISTMVKMADADGSGTVERSKKEMALFTYSEDAKDILDLLDRGASEAEINLKVENMWEKYGDTTKNASAAAGLMLEIDKDCSGAIEASEMVRIEGNKNIDNIRDIYNADEQSDDFRKLTFDFDKFFNYATLVNVNDDGEISSDEAVAFGYLIKSEKGIKAKNSEETVSQATFLATVKKHINGEELTEAESEIVKNLKAGNYVVNSSETTSGADDKQDNLESTSSSSNSSETENNAGNGGSNNSSGKFVEIKDNVITFGNGKTVAIPSGAKAEISADGKSVVIKSEGQGKLAISNPNKKYYQKLVITTKYDEKGNPVEEKREIYSPHVSKNKEVSYNYNGYELVQKEFDDAGNATKETTKKFNKQGKKTGTSTVVENEYDSSGNNTKATTSVYTVHDVLTKKSSVENKYNDAGKLVETIDGSYKGKDKNVMTHSTAVKFDDDGNKTQTTRSSYNSKTGELMLTDTSAAGKGRTFENVQTGEKVIMTITGANAIYVNKDGQKTIIPHNDSFVDVNVDGSLVVKGRKYSDGWDCSQCGSKSFPAGSQIVSVSGSGYVYTIKLPNGEITNVDTRNF